MRTVLFFSALVMGIVSAFGIAGVATWPEMRSTIVPEAYRPIYILGSFVLTFGGAALSFLFLTAAIKEPVPYMPWSKKAKRKAMLESARKTLDKRAKQRTVGLFLISVGGILAFACIASAGELAIATYNLPVPITP